MHEIRLDVRRPDRRHRAGRPDQIDCASEFHQSLTQLAFAVVARAVAQCAGTHDDQFDPHKAANSVRPSDTLSGRRDAGDSSSDDPAVLHRHQDPSDGLGTGLGFACGVGRCAGQTLMWAIHPVDRLVHRNKHVGRQGQ